MNILQICPRHLLDVAALLWEIRNKSSSTILLNDTLLMVYVISEENKNAVQIYLRRYNAVTFRCRIVEYCGT